MKASTFFKQIFLGMALGFMTLALNAQTTVNNNPGASADFTSLQAAINAATAGDVIYVQHSPTTYGNIIINKGVIIIGRSSRDNGYKTTVGNLYLSNGVQTLS